MIISTAQTKPIAGNVEENIEQHLELIDYAIQSNSDVIVFPELSLTGYEPTLAKKLATTSSDSRFDTFQSISDKNKLTIIIGCPIRDDSAIHIGSIIFQPNTSRKTYLKKHLFHTETTHFEAKDSVTTFSINGQTIAPAICYEISVQEHQEFAYADKFEFYLASVVEDEKLIAKAFEKMSNISKRYHVISLMSNCIGLSGGYQCGGHSAIWNEKGELVVKLNQTVIEISTYNTETRTTKTVKKA